MIINFSKKERSKTLKKLLLISLVCILVFGFALTALAVDLTVWSGGYYGPDPYEGWYFDKVIKEFQEIYPDVNIEVEMLSHIGGVDKVAIGIATGTTADIYFGGAPGLAGYDMQGLLVDFSDIMTQEQIDDYLPGYVETFGIDGKMNMYLVMGIVGAGGMGFNKVLVEKAGLMHLLPLDRPYRHWTLDEYKIFLEEMTKWLRENNMDDTFTFTFNFGNSSGNTVIIMMIFQDGFGVDPFEVVDGRYKSVLNTPKAVEALQTYLDIYSDPKYGMKPGAENTFLDWWENYWVTGRLVSCYGEGAGTAKWYSQQPEGFDEILQQMIIPFPNGPGGSPTMGITGVGITAFKTGDAEKEKYSKLFAQFFATRPDMAEVTDVHFPPTYSSYDPDSPLYQKPLFAGLPEVQWDLKRTMNDPDLRLIGFGHKSPVYRQFKDIFAQTMQGVFTDVLTVQEGLDMVVEKTNKLLDEYYEENPVE